MSGSAITLADVLTADELAAQPWPGDLVLNDSGWMSLFGPGQVFARMPVAEQRAYTLNALAYARLSRGHPAWCLGVLLELAASPPPRWSQ